MIFVVILFLLFILIAGGVSLLFLSKKNIKPRKREEPSREPVDNEKDDGPMHHVSELVPAEFIEDGIYAVGGLYCGVGIIDGTNFSVMSEADQNNREAVLIDILTRMGYPYQFVTTTIVTNTGLAAKEISQKWHPAPDSTLKTYAVLYAKVLDDMQRERQLLSQRSWLVLTDDGSEGDPVEKLKEKMGLIMTALQQRAGVIFTPLLTLEDAVDVFGQIINPDSLTRPSDYLPDLQPIHISESEVLSYESKAREKTKVGYAQ